MAPHVSSMGFKNTNWSTSFQGKITKCIFNCCSVGSIFWLRHWVMVAVLITQYWYNNCSRFVDVVRDLKLFKILHMTLTFLYIVQHILYIYVLFSGKRIVVPFSENNWFFAFSVINCCPLLHDYYGYVRPLCLRIFTTTILLITRLSTH